MARRSFEMVDQIEMYVHWYAGRSQVQIAQSLGWTARRCAITWPRWRRPG